MSVPRTRSEDRAVRGYGGSVPTDSRKTPNGFRVKRNPGRDGQGREEAVNLARARFQSAMEWAEANLPDEYAPFVAASALTTKALQHRYPTPDEVRERLKEQGRDMATLTAGKGSR